jgi:hypothetical protein
MKKPLPTLKEMERDTAAMPPENRQRMMALWKAISDLRKIDLNGFRITFELGGIGLSFEEVAGNERKLSKQPG